MVGTRGPRPRLPGVRRWARAACGCGQNPLRGVSDHRSGRQLAEVRSSGQGRAGVQLSLSIR